MGSSGEGASRRWRWAGYGALLLFGAGLVYLAVPRLSSEDVARVRVMRACGHVYESCRASPTRSCLPRACARIPSDSEGVSCQPGEDGTVALSDGGHEIVVQVQQIASLEGCATLALGPRDDGARDE